MTDARLQTLARSTDPADQPRLVRALRRAGQTDHPAYLRARALAFVGVAWAREATPPCDGEWNDELSLSTRFAVLAGLLRPLPPLLREVPCPHGPDCPVTCPPCTGTGTRTADVRADRWLLTRALVDCGRESHGRTIHAIMHPSASQGCFDCAVPRALDAAEQWLRCPCEGCGSDWWTVTPRSQTDAVVRVGLGEAAA